MAFGAEILIITDERLYGEALARAVEAETESRVHMPGSLSRDPLALLERFSPDLILLDARLPKEGLLSITESLDQQGYKSPVIAFGGSPDQEDRISCMVLGAHAYADRDLSLEAFIGLMNQVLKGESTCPSELNFVLFSRLAELARKHQQARRYESAQLTLRQLEILKLISRGLSNRKIAKTLYISLHTVKNHVHNILDRLQVKNRVNAVQVGYEQGWLRRPALLGADPANRRRKEGTRSRSNGLEN